MRNRFPNPRFKFPQQMQAMGKIRRGNGDQDWQEKTADRITSLFSIYISIEILYK